MAGPDDISANRSVTLEGRTLSGAATGPALDSYRTAGGVYTEIYNAVGQRLGTTNEATILRELHRQDDAQTVSQTPAHETAVGIVNGARESFIFGDSVNTEQIAGQLLQIRRDNPEQAAEVERLIYVELGNAGDQSRLMQDITTAIGHVADADTRIATLGADSTAVSTVGSVIDRATLTTRANALIEGATERIGAHRGNPMGLTHLNVHELAYQVELLAAENPRLAQVLRSELTTRLASQDAATLNRVLAGDTGFGEGIGRAFAHPVDGAIGAVKGIGNGFIAVGDLLVRGSAYQVAGEQEQAAAFASLFGNEEQAAEHREFAAGMRTAAGSEMIPQIPYSNIAQSGGGDVGTVVDVALAGKGIVTGGARLLARNADEAARVAVGSADEVFRVTTPPLGVRFEGTIYRLENPERLSTTFDTHAGNIAADHRYSGPGQGAVYGSASPDTAMAEMSHYGLTTGRVSANRAVSLDNVLDLTNPATRRDLNLTLDQITSDSYDLTQQIGSWARENGYDAILAPSARNLDGANLIVFPKD